VDFVAYASLMKGGREYVRTKYRNSRLANLPLGIKAKATHPRKSVKAGKGDTQVTLAFAGVTVSPGSMIYADADGILVSNSRSD